MSRYSTAQTTPTAPAQEGDPFFDRVNEKEERSSLPPGTLAKSVNKRLRRKKAECREGTWPPVFSNIAAPTSIRGFGVYSNPNGDEVLLVAGLNEVYVIKDGSYPTTIAVDSSLASSVEFVQAHDKVIIFQGLLKRQLMWDGVDSKGFKQITKSNPADTSTKLIPKAITAEHVSDRLVIISGRNTVIATDILDYTSYDAALEEFFINRDSGDGLVRIFNYAKGIVICFGSRSTALLLNFEDDPTLATIELLNSHLGLAGRKAVEMLGGDVLFLSDPGGIYRIAQSFESRLQAIPLPVTDPIQPLIDRINWKAATGAVAKANGEYVYFAVPIDGSKVNNCMIVFNGATDIIEGYDTWPSPFQIDDLAVTLYQGERRLFALDKNAKRIYLMYEGKSDFIYDPGTETTTEHPIADLIETRGFQSPGYNPASRSYDYSTRRDFKNVEIGLSTWAPSLTVTELTEAANDERPLNSNPITKSRTEYYTFGRKNFDLTNANDDWDLPGREDYSMIIDDTGFDPGSGIDFDRKQNCTLRFATKARGRYVSYRIEGNGGQSDVLGVLMESTGTQREPRRAG